MAILAFSVSDLSREIYLVVGFGNSNFLLVLADIFNALMAIPNLVALLLLSPVIVSETKKYLWDDNIEAIDSEPTI